MGAGFYSVSYPVSKLFFGDVFAFDDFDRKRFIPFATAGDHLRPWADSIKI